MRRIFYPILPPPGQFLHNSLNVAKIPLCICLVGCSPVSAAKSDTETSQIDSFDGYDLDIDDSNYTDICSGVSDKYGDPSIQKPSTGWGECSMWIDDSQNVIVVSETLGLLYFQNNDTLTDLFSESLEKFHEIDIENELKKAGDGYVGY